jgi:PAT family beta-lactamase induction signal transducer AmpG
MNRNKMNVWHMLKLPRMWINIGMGFYAGLPLLLVGQTLKAWLTREHVDISTIGYFSWVGMSYSLKFFWSPLLDRYVPHKIGRRKSWLMIAQTGLVLGLIGMSSWHSDSPVAVLAGFAALVAFFSATQDIAIDAHRRELMMTEELGMASAMYTYGYRIAVYVSGGIAIGMVGAGSLNLTWNELYICMAVLMSTALVFTYFVPEPKIDGGPPKTLGDAIFDPLIEFFKRKGAWVILAFVLLFKFGETFGASMLNPFYIQMGYSNQDIALIAKTVGLIASMIGLFLGGLIIARFGVYKSLWGFGIFQALATAGFALITITGPERWALALAIVAEDVSGGMGSAAFLAFLSGLTNRRFTATQYAALSSIALLGRNFFSGFAGDLVKSVGWAQFFICSGVMAIPGLVLLVYMKQHSSASD